MPSLHPRVCDLDFSARGLLGLLHKGVDHYEALSLRCEIDRARNTVFPSHPYFPEFALKWSNMRLPNFLRPKLFEKFGNPQEVSVHVNWKTP